MNIFNLYNIYAIFVQIVHRCINIYFCLCVCVYFVCMNCICITLIPLKVYLLFTLAVNRTITELSKLYILLLSASCHSTNQAIFKQHRKRNHEISWFVYSPLGVCVLPQTFISLFTSSSIYIDTTDKQRNFKPNLNL